VAVGTHHRGDLAVAPGGPIRCVLRGTQIATVAVALKLLARSFHLLNQVHAPPTTTTTTTTTSGEGQSAG
jgi:hypothetical protein